MAPHATAKGLIQTRLKPWTVKPNKATISMGETPKPDDTNLRFSGGRNF